MGAHNIANYNPTPTELEFIRKTHASCTAFIFICAGVCVAIQAQLLDNLTATGPREMLPLLRNMAPKTDWIEKRWVQDGKIWTSGALLSGLDLMREFVRLTWGSAETIGDKGDVSGNLADWSVEVGCWPRRGVEYDGKGVAGVIEAL